MSMLNMLLATGGIDTLKNGFSGSSIVENFIGFQTSRFGYRAYYYDSETSTDYSGSWQAVSPIGIFSGESNPTINAAAAGYGVSGSLLRVQVRQYNTYGDWVTFDIKTKQFTGNSIAQYTTYSSHRLTTAGGLIRFESVFGSKYGSTAQYAQYVSLT